MVINATELRTIAKRYEAHLDAVEGAKQGFKMRPGQMGLGRDIIDFMGEKHKDGGINDRGYFVRPTGTGKTVSLIDFIIGANTLPSGKSVLGNATHGKRSLVMVPANFLLDQWEDELLGKLKEDGSREPSKWGDAIKREHVGIYRADDSEEKKQEALSKPIVCVTYDSARILCADKRAKLRIKPDDFAITVLDEVHDKPRGDVTSDFIKEEFFGHSFVLGATATHLYKSNKTIGDYLFDGAIPIHETTFREAVNRGEICPMRNVIAEVELDAEQESKVKEIVDNAIKRAKEKRASLEDVDFTSEELERIVEISKRDEAAIRLLQRGFDPDTGKKYRDMKQVWYCATVDHAEKVAAQLNQMMGDENYAVAVNGDMAKGEQSRVLLNYKKGDHKAVTNCQLLTMGFDDQEAELCMQLAPTCSPPRSLQQGGRVMRIDPKNPHKIANIVTFVYPQIPNQIIFGELAGGLTMIPGNFEYGPSSPRMKGEEPAPWLEIEGLKVHYTTEQLQLFKEKRTRHAEIPNKKPDMFTLDEMVAEIFPGVSGGQLEREKVRLRDRIYQPLQDAYDIREARAKEIKLEGSDLTVSGQRFPVSLMGYCKEGGKEVFYVKNIVAAGCRHGIYGRIFEPASDMISENQAQTLLAVKEKEKWLDIIDPLKDAYLDRPAYARNVPIGNLSIPIEHLQFTKATTGSLMPTLSLKPDALLPLYQYAKGVSKEVAEEWWKKHPILPQLKTSNWLNHDDVKEALGIGPLSDKQLPFEKLWKQIETKSKTGPTVNKGEARLITLAVEGTKQDDLQVAQKNTISDPKNKQLCIEESGLDMIRHMLGIDSDYVVPEGKGRKKV